MDTQQYQIPTDEELRLRCQQEAEELDKRPGVVIHPYLTCTTWRIPLRYIPHACITDKQLEALVNLEAKQLVLTRFHLVPDELGYSPTICTKMFVYCQENGDVGAARITPTGRVKMIKIPG